MKKHKTSRRGIILALGILILAVGVAFWGRLYYQARHPMALEARFLNENQVLATFDPKHDAILRTGLPASISSGRSGYSGFISNQNGKSTYVISLDPGPAPPVPGQNCRVIVDASIAPEFLKPRSQSPAPSPAK